MTGTEENQTERAVAPEDGVGITRSRHVWTIAGPDECVMFALRCQPVDAGAHVLVIGPEDLRTMLAAMEGSE